MLVAFDDSDDPSASILIAKGRARRGLYSVRSEAHLEEGKLE